MFVMTEPEKLLLCKGTRVDNGEPIEGFYVLTRYTKLGRMFDNSNAKECDYQDNCRKINGREWFSAIQSSVSPMEIHQIFPDSVKRFTGITVRNRPVFEGDTVRYRYYDEKGIYREKCEVVEWNELLSGFEPFCHWTYTYCDISKIEIIK